METGWILYVLFAVIMFFSGAKPAAVKWKNYSKKATATTNAYSA